VIGSPELPAGGFVIFDFTMVASKIKKAAIAKEAKEK
jgi:hypothetical protein